MIRSDILIVEREKQVFIESINQYQTYRGHISGMPNLRINKSIIENTLKEATEKSNSGKAYLIVPIQKPLTTKESKVYNETPMALPDVICIAELLYYEPLTNPDRFISCLCAVWFQDSYAFPIDEYILYKFKKLKWSELAAEFNF